MNHLPRLILSSLIVIGFSTTVTAAAFTVSTSFNSGADSLSIAPDYGPGGPMQFSSYTTQASEQGYTPLNLAGVQMTASPSGFSSYSSSFKINITIKQDGTGNVGTIVLDDLMSATSNPLGLGTPYGYSFSENHDLKFDPSSGSSVFFDGRYAEAIVGGTLFSLDLFTFNSYFIDGDQSSKEMPGPYVAMYAQPGTVPEPTTALILISGLGIAFAANRILDRKQIRPLPASLTHGR